MPQPSYQERRSWISPRYGQENPARGASVRIPDGQARERSARSSLVVGDNEGEFAADGSRRETLVQVGGRSPYDLLELLGELARRHHLDRAEHLPDGLERREHAITRREFGDAIFKFAAARDAVVLTHSSEQNSLAADFVPFANAYPQVRLILANIGCGWDGDFTHQVRAIQQRGAVLSART